MKRTREKKGGMKRKEKGREGWEVKEFRREERFIEKSIKTKYSIAGYFTVGMNRVGCYSIDEILFIWTRRKEEDKSCANIGAAIREGTGTTKKRERKQGGEKTRERESDRERGEREREMMKARKESQRGQGCKERKEEEEEWMDGGQCKNVNVLYVLQMYPQYPSFLSVPVVSGWGEETLFFWCCLYLSLSVVVV